MAMSLAALEILEQAQLPPAHARAIARAIEADSNARWKDLATKADVTAFGADLSLLKSELKGEIASGKSELKGEIASVKNEVMNEITSVKNELTSEITSVKSELTSKIASVKSELTSKIASVKSELTSEIASVRIELKVEMRDMRSDLLRWMFLAVMAQTAASGGLMYFLLNLMRS